MGFIGTHQIVTCSSSFQRTARLGKPLPFPVPNARHPQRSTGFNGTSRDLVGINHIWPYVYTYLTMFLPHMPIFNQHSGHSVKENTHHISNDSHLWTSHTEFHRDPSASKHFDSAAFNVFRSWNDVFEAGTADWWLTSNGVKLTPPCWDMLEAAKPGYLEVLCFWSLTLQF